MNIEIKFRAKTLSTNDWVFGDLHLLTKFPHIHDREVSKSLIHTETIGQFTGLHDKNGKEIYEGDILIHIYMGSIFKVEYSERNAAFMLIYPTNEGYNMGIYDIENCFRVIGNIYDNPELFKEE